MVATNPISVQLNRPDLSEDGPISEEEIKKITDLTDKLWELNFGTGPTNDVFF